MFRFRSSDNAVTCRLRVYEDEYAGSCRVAPGALLRFGGSVAPGSVTAQQPPVFRGGVQSIEVDGARGALHGHVQLARKIVVVHSRDVPCGTAGSSPDVTLQRMVTADNGPPLAEEPRDDRSADLKTREHIRRWFDGWQHAGRLLDQERSGALETMTDGEAQQAAQQLFELWQHDWPSDEGEGLLLQQRVFARVARRLRS